jgi:drug/metabolite transporter (DMT)-like permease
VSLVAASLLCLGSAVWFASSWLDHPDEDITCGSLWRTELWRHVHGCTGPMTLRLVVALALACLALVGLLLAAIRPPRRALMVSAVIVIVAVVVLVVNEYFRSGGSFAN